MFQPAPRELCDILQKMGCVSKSGLRYTKCSYCHGSGIDNDPPVGYWADCDNCQGEGFEVSTPRIFVDEVHAFFQNDFTGATNIADENCKIAWPDSDWTLRKKGMIWCHSTHPFEAWFEYLQRTMRKI